MRDSQSADGVRRCLETWGEIAAHLNVEVRTAQRWERKIGMPVRRLEGSQAVYAYVDDLDRWRESRETLTVPDAGARRAPSDEIAVTPLAPPTAPAPAQSGTRRPLANRLLLLSGAALAVLATSAYVATSFSIPREPVTFAVEGRRLIATDSSNGIVWTHEFALPTRQADTKYRHSLTTWWERLDADGDGVDEIMAVVGHPTGEQEHREALYCFSLDGRLKYSYLPALTLTFDQATFSGPWRFWDLEAVPSDGSLWVALESVAMWPSVAVRIDPKGGTSLRFAQPGLIRALEAIEVDGRPRVLAGGVNNEYGAASLAMLDADGTAATAPQLGRGPYTCRNCPAGTPLVYVLLPPSPLNRLLGLPYNQVQSLSASRGQVTVGSLEALADNFSALVSYSLDSNLRATQARPSDAYWTWAAPVESWRGRVGHPSSFRVRHWTENRWTASDVGIASVSEQ